MLIIGCGNSGARIAIEWAKDRQVHVSAGKPPTFVPQEILGKSIFWWFMRLGVYKANLDTRIGQRIIRRGDPVIGTHLKKLIRSGSVTLHSRTLEVSEDRFIFRDGTRLQVSNVIWATGYSADYSWLSGISHALDAQGRPNHLRGISQAEGVYFLGLPWQYYRESTLIGGMWQTPNICLARLPAACRGRLINRSANPPHDLFHHHDVKEGHPQRVAFFRFQ